MNLYASNTLTAFIKFSIVFNTIHLLRRKSLILFCVRSYSASNILYASLRTAFGFGGAVLSQGFFQNCLFSAVIISICKLKIIVYNDIILNCKWFLEIIYDIEKVTFWLVFIVQIDFYVKKVKKSITFSCNRVFFCYTTNNHLPIFRYRWDRKHPRLFGVEVRDLLKQVITNTPSLTARGGVFFYLELLITMKKSFILHYDSLSVIDKMTDDQTGKLLRMMKSYHNGRYYICNDFAVELVFEQFKNQFDRDLIKYNNICERNSNNGKKWWRPQEPKEPSGLITNPKEPKKADSDSDNKNDSDNDSDNVNKNDIIKEETTTEVVPWKKKSIINQHNKQWAIDIYDKIKEMCVVVDWDLNDCVVLRSKLLNYWPDPVNLLELLITKMRDTGLSKFYSVSSPWKLADHIGTIVEKLKSEKPKKTLKVF